MPVLSYFGSKSSKLKTGELKDERTEDGDVSGYFGTGKVPRDPRSPTVKYKIGQVLKHNTNHYRAVIIGWDETPNIPEGWAEKIDGNEPAYLILIDARDQQMPQFAYILERHIIPSVAGQRVIHSSLDKYFESFNGNEYTPRPWLQRIYPFG